MIYELQTICIIRWSLLMVKLFQTNEKKFHQSQGILLFLDCTFDKWECCFSLFFSSHPLPDRSRTLTNFVSFQWQLFVQRNNLFPHPFHRLIPFFCFVIVLVEFLSLLPDPDWLDLDFWWISFDWTRRSWWRGHAGYYVVGVVHAAPVADGLSRTGCCCCCKGSSLLRLSCEACKMKITAVFYKSLI